MNLAEYSRHLGVNSKTVKTQVLNGAIPCVRDGNQYIIDVAAADIAWLENVNPNFELPETSIIEKLAGPKPIAPEVSQESKTYADYRKEKEKWASKKARIEYEFKAGALVEADKVKQIAFETGRVTRDNLMSLPDRLSHELAGEMDPKKISLRLEDEIIKCLDEINRVPEKLKRLTENILKNKRKGETDE